MPRGTGAFYAGTGNAQLYALTSGSFSDKPLPFLTAVTFGAALGCAFGAAFACEVNQDHVEMSPSRRCPASLPRRQLEATHLSNIPEVIARCHYL